MKGQPYTRVTSAQLILSTLTLFPIRSQSEGLGFRTLAYTGGAQISSITFLLLSGLNLQSLTWHMRSPCLSIPVVCSYLLLLGCPTPSRHPGIPLMLALPASSPSERLCTLPLNLSIPYLESLLCCILGPSAVVFSTSYATVWGWFAWLAFCKAVPTMLPYAEVGTRQAAAFGESSFLRSLDGTSVPSPHFQGLPWKPAPLFHIQLCLPFPPPALSLLPPLMGASVMMWWSHQSPSHLASILYAHHLQWPSWVLGILWVCSTVSLSRKPTFVCSYRLNLVKTLGGPFSWNTHSLRKILWKESEKYYSTVVFSTF